MTVKELREMLNNVSAEYEDASVVIFQGNGKFEKVEKVEVEGIRQICSPMGKPCCVELRVKK